LMNGNSLSVQPMMNGGCTMTGTYNPVNKTFSASCVYTGTCNETYNLIGTFAANNSWSGTWTVGFSGQCFDCTFQSRSLTGTKL
ncbi:MAG: hypothetical protein FJ098_06670, partial [Deltaproteobacteria bacterium]|nr:hypothetical protein [Deltaproteobacteria bacterium]